MKATMIFAALLTLTLVGCGKRAESTAEVGVEFSVDKLFTVDGCTVYRFRDYGSARYFTNCRGSTGWEESCGKWCIHGVGVEGGAK